MSSFDEQAQAIMDSFPSFYSKTDAETSHTLDQLDVLQVNVGRLCNLACRHCHMEASPASTDIMTRETWQHCLDACFERGFKTIDITGGAPEMNPDFEWALRQAAAHGVEVIVRTNLVVMLEEPYAHFAQLYADLGVTLFASLPHYTKKTVDKQRGDAVFDGSIAMLQKLNSLGYGRDADKVLNLVFNPSGAFLPPDQEALEREYKAKLEVDFGIVFNNLFALTNNPCGRFGARLAKTGNLKRYMQKLVDAFNPDTVPAMMCRTQLSVGWDGRTYDCDFNQAADLPCKDGRTIADYAADLTLPLRRAIAFGNHCYACTAGAGSS